LLRTIPCLSWKHSFLAGLAEVNGLIVSGANGLTTVGVTTLNGVDNFGVVVPSFGVVTGSLMGGSSAT